jgi:acetylornithine deacetylase/succinyl-diaminopimelate desuccinylase-like protein
LILKLKYINGKYQVIRSRNKDRFIKELIELLKIPSVSADTAYSQDVIDTSEAVKLSLEQAGCDFVEI